MASVFRFHSLRGQAPRPAARHLALTPLATAAALLAQAGVAGAQEAAAPAVQSVQVVGRASDTAGVTGFSQALSRTPIQVDTFDEKTLRDIGATSLSDLTRLDASITDSYNAIGYWTTFTVRGFQVDNRYNFRRDGLPINAETSLPLDDKSGVEVLKGLSGMQAGTSAPGGIVNLVVKRPDADLRDVALRWSQPGTVGVAVDLSQRFGADRAFGARLDVSADHLDPNVRDAKGHRQVAALATDWRIDADHLLEVEFEHSLQSQPSVPAFSMLGDTVPDPHSINPRINLNDQPWSLPVVLQGNTMSVRYTQALSAQWKFRVHALQQQLVSNDHLAFPYGYYPADGVGEQDDRFGSNGHYSIWDFRSDGERRQTRDLDVSLAGEFATGSVHHSLTFGALGTVFTGRFHDEAYNLVGTGTIDGNTVVPSNPATDDPNTNRTERSTELYLRDAVEIAPDWTAWLGVRHTRLHRETWATSGDPQATDYKQSFTTPWLSLSHQLTTRDMVYVSWGEGVESSVVPNEPDVYVNAGQALPSAISKQWEVGYKHAGETGRWGLTAYDVVQPQWLGVPVSAPTADHPDATKTQQERDGNIRARGLEAEASGREGALTLGASAMWQRVHSEGATAPDVGTIPVNVPMKSVKLAASYAVRELPGLSVLANMAYEGGREVLPDDSARIPGWTRYGLGARYDQPIGSTTLVWRAGVDNLFDRRAWREAPYQYEHAYLFPLEARTFFASVEAKF